MIENIPSYLTIVYLVLASLLLAYFWKMLYTAFGKKTANLAISGLVLWAVLQCSLAATGFYLNFEGMPPRFVLVVVPVFAFMFYLAARHSETLQKLDFVPLTFIHLVRIPVEVLIYVWFVYECVPQEMTFEGRNFDILAGITAPLAVYFLIKHGAKTHFKLIYSWNILSLMLLINIIITAVLSAPTAFQKMGLTQPNIAIFHAPFILLPALIVPIVFFCHMVSILKLREIKKELEGA